MIFFTFYLTFHAPVFAEAFQVILSATVHVKRMLARVCKGLLRELTGGGLQRFCSCEHLLSVRLRLFNEDDTWLLLGYHDLSFAFTYHGIPSIQASPRNRSLETASCPPSVLLFSMSSQHWSHALGICFS